MLDGEDLSSVIDAKNRDWSAILADITTEIQNKAVDGFMLRKCITNKDFITLYFQVWKD